MPIIGWDKDGNPIDGEAVIGWDAEGKPVREKDRGKTRPTPAVSTPDAAVAPLNPTPKASGGNVFQQISRAVTGEGQRQRGVGEAAYTSIPEEKDQQFEGPLAPVANALPQPVRNFLGAQQKAAAVGLGFFLNPNERARALIIKRQVPSSQFRRDEYGNLQVRYREDQPWAYINRPGISGEDVQTFANEAGKFLVSEKIPGFRAAPGGTLIGNTARVGATGVATSVAGQAASMPLGADEINAGDVAVSGIGAAAGNVLGQGVIAPAIRGAPMVARAVGDRLPGGAARAAERANSLEQARLASEAAARKLAEDTVRANAQQINLTGEALEAEVRAASDRAAEAVNQQFGRTPANDLDRLARTFGVRLARAQATGDVEGMRFLYEAAGGLHGPAAQRSAAAFLETQNRALPEAIRGIAGDTSVASPQAALNVTRRAMEDAQAAAKAEETAAWDAFDSAVPRGRTYDVTPFGKPGAAKFVRDRIQSLLVRDKKMIRPEEGPPMMLPEFEATYPRVARTLSLIDKMADQSKTQLPLRDVDRVIQLKRFIDAQWEGSQEPAERRLLTMMGKEVRDWLKSNGGAYISDGAGGTVAANLSARGATVTNDALQNALGISARNAKQFTENPVIEMMLDRRAAMTDEEISRRIFGGGQGGLNVSSDGVSALRTIKETLGPSHPAWEQLRQGALQRLTRGLDDALATNQTPAILTTFKRIEEAFRANKEAMEVLFTPDELAKLRQAQRIVAAMAPTPRNPANPTNSGIVAGRAMARAVEMVTAALKQVPGANIVAGGVADVSAAARVNKEISGAGASDISDAIRSAFYAKRSSTLAPLGSAYATQSLNDPQP